jgi:hypothetical protein
MSDYGDALLYKFEHHRGPMSGQGRGNGRPFKGIIGEVPCVWIGWVVGTARRMGISPDALRLEWSGEPLTMASVQLTYGVRWFWVCPMCGRRCEALFSIGGRQGCRKCHHLGYRSQCNRPGSPWPVLDLAFSRSGPVIGNRYWPGDNADALAKALAAHLKGLLTNALASLEVYPTDG